MLPLYGSNVNSVLRLAFNPHLLKINRFKLTESFFMPATSADLAWIVVQDLNKAKKFFTETLGFKVTTESQEWGWIELEGEKGGMTIGLAKDDAHSPIARGSNAIITLTVANIDNERKLLESKGVKLLGDIMEVPGHVKMQLFTDSDGNHFQLVQMLEHK
jgi:predicted enzyme related to lactoylglutathione lyase